MVSASGMLVYNAYMRMAYMAAFFFRRIHQVSNQERRSRATSPNCGLDRAASGEPRDMTFLCYDFDNKRTGKLSRLVFMEK